MARPFEDPVKTELRGRCKIAIDMAGHELVDEPEPLLLPESAGVKGRIRGDLQSLDGEQTRHVYYLRTNPEQPLPTWLAAFARVARDLEDCRFFIVTDQSSPILEKSCRASGAGLLVLTVDNTFELAVGLDEYEPDKKRELVADKARDLRRQLDDKFGLNHKNLTDNHSKATQLTAGLSQEDRDKYISGIEEALSVWARWNEAVSAKLDEAVALADEALLAAAEKLIRAGAVLEDDQDS